METPIRLFNTLTGQKENFKPIDVGQVRMYNCGPTVYNFAHIGNLRAYVFADTLRRTLEYNGYKVHQVMNITDVGHLTSDADDGDDKMVKALKREGEPMTLEGLKKVADKYTTAFVDDLKALNCEIPQEMPRASEHIAEDIEIIKILEQKGIAYRTSDGIYFDTSKFPDYGKLGNINLKGQLAGARVAVNSEKKNPTDFSLWKVSPREDSGQAPLGWESPWGKGFPGWHIECSAMSRRYLGQPFDIHTGGIDHIPVHHNNEIAQSEAAFGVPLANYWMHNEHLIVADGKMAKSGENFITLNSIVEKGYSRPAMTYRYYLLGASYGTPMMFSFEALGTAEITLDRLVISLANMPENGEIDPGYEKKFKEAVNDNLNTSEGLAVLWNLIRDEKISPANRRATALKFDDVLGLDLKNTVEETKHAIDLPADVEILVKKRKDARNSEDWKKSDELREEIKKLGFSVKDTDNGQKLEKI